MKVKFQLLSWQNVKNDVISIFPLRKKEVELLENLISKKDEEKILAMVDRLIKNKNLQGNIDNSIKAALKDKMTHLSGTKNFNSYDRVNQRIFQIQINPLYLDKSSIGVKSYMVFMDFLTRLSSLDDAIVLDEIIDALELRAERKGLDNLNAELKAIILSSGTNVYSYSGDKKILNLIEYLAKIQNSGIIREIEKILFCNKGKVAFVDRYAEGYVNKIFIETRRAEFESYKVSREALIRAACVHYVYNILCSICYKAAVKSAVIIVNQGA